MAAGPARSADSPFYTQTTGVEEIYRDNYDKEVKVPLNLVTLPAGTVLFRGVKIPNPSAGEDVRYFYRDYLGDPEGEEKVCLRPTHNVFFYPFPYVPFGIHTVGATFHSMQAVVLVKPMTVISAVGPSPMVRGEPKKYLGENSPFSRCTTYDYRCHPATAREYEAEAYDNCINPNYAVKSGVRGWMAIANLDSIKPVKEGRYSKSGKSKSLPASESPMGKYILALEKRQKGMGAMLLSWMYIDANRRTGFPELALYPYAKHQGPKIHDRVCRDSRQAIIHMEREAAADNLNYLPLAAFTKDITVDMMNGHFSYECLGVASNTFSTPPPEYHGQIEQRVLEWMDAAQTRGLDLPFYGKGKLSFDSRTGFYVLPQVVPRGLRIPIPEMENGKTTIPYSFLIHPLETGDDKRRVLTYMLLFRTFIPGQAMRKFGLEKEYGVRRAMIFNRPPTLKWVYDELGLPMPDEVNKILGRAAAQYKANTGAKTKKEMEAEAAAAAATAKPAVVEEEEEKANAAPGALTNRDFFTVWNAWVSDNEKVSPNKFKTKPLDTLLDEYKELLEDFERGKEFEEDEKIRAYYTPETTPPEVASKKAYLFGPELAPKMMVDDVAMFSITQRGESMKQAQLLFRELAQIIGPERARAATITDATACVGGNTLTFAELFARVNAVEISPQRAFMLANNVIAAGKEGNVKIHCADYTKIMTRLQQDIIFFDPPWGGVDYREKKELKMSLGSHDLSVLIKELLGFMRYAYLVGVKAPENFDIAGLKESLRGSGAFIVQIYKMKKMIFIIIKSGYFSEDGKPANSPVLYVGPSEPQNLPSQILGGGKRKTRVKGRGLGNKTRKRSPSKSIKFAQDFSKVWAAHAKVKAGLN